MVNFSTGENRIPLLEYLPGIISPGTISKSWSRYGIPGFIGIELRQITTADCIILGIEFMAEAKNVVLTLEMTGSALVLHINLKGGLQYKMAGLSDTWLLQSQFELFYAAQLVGEIRFDKPGKYRSVFVIPHAIFLTRLTPLYPLLTAFMNIAVRNKAMAFSPVPEFIRPEWVFSIHLLLNPPGELNQYQFVHAQLTELCMLMFDELVFQASSPYQFPPEDSNTEKLAEAAKYILGHLGDYKTIGTLSRKMGMNADLLQKGFLNLFGMGVHEFAVRARLEKAMQLLTGTNFNIADIAEEVGFNYTGAFSRFFRKKTGETPQAFRERNTRSSNDSAQ